MVQYQEAFEFAVRIAGCIETDIKHLALAYRSFVTALNIL